VEIDMAIRGLFLALALAVASGPSGAKAEGGISYLESLKGKPERYLAPSEIDPRFTIALYVNVATSGTHKQRMWFLERETLGGKWRMSLWDERYWKRKAKLAAGERPPFSWLVSSGRYYRGDRRSGPTPLGVYGIDERKGRYGRGWMAAGMIHVLYIDYHYSSGRRSGVAFHGTTRGRYRRLGRNDSHGCIRMHQKNALRVFDRMTGRDKVLSKEMRWGEVPRFWTTEKGRTRRGYVRDGSMHLVPDVSETSGADQAGLSLVSDAHASEAAGGSRSDVLTKQGFRALAVIFKD
jgi:L,D-transpeptidase catalytic domain